jgi:hypothetical protein
VQALSLAQSEVAMIAFKMPQRVAFRRHCNLCAFWEGKIRDVFEPCGCVSYKSKVLANENCDAFEMRQGGIEDPFYFATSEQGEPTIKCCISARIQGIEMSVLIDQAINEAIKELNTLFNEAVKQS